MKILFLGANGLDTARLRIAEELRDVRAELERAKDRKDIEILAELAVRPVDLNRVLLDERPDVVHFSGHGVELRVDAPRGARRTREFDAADDDVLYKGVTQGAILLENNEGTSTTVPPDALTGLFGILKAQRCVVLNACFSAEQAKRIAEHVDCVIGMSRAIGDDSALVFSAGFYQALARGTSVQEAFLLGQKLVQMNGLPDADVPELYCRKGVDPNEVRFIGGHRTVASGKRWWIFPRKIVIGALGASWMGLGLAALWIDSPMIFPKGESGKGTVVVVGPGNVAPWVSAEQGNRAARALCDAMNTSAYDTEPRVVCQVRGKRGELEVLRREVIEAGASVFVAVDKDGVGRVYPLGAVAEHDLFGRGLPAVDLGREKAANALAPLVREWAKVADGAKEDRLDTSRLRCGESVAHEPIGIALPTLVLRRYATNCSSIREDVDQLRPQCRDESCKILDWLGEEPISMRGDCDGQSDWRERIKCMSERAKVACESGKKKDALQWIATIDAAANPIYAIKGSEIAACALVHQKDLSNEEKKMLEARADRIEPECETSVCETSVCKYCMASVATRAAYWVHVRDWARAERDYGRAYLGDPQNEYLLGVVGSRLHRFREMPADKLAQMTGEELQKIAKPNGRELTRAALFKWVAQKRGGNATYIDAAEKELVKAHGRLADGASVYEKLDESERSLLCLRSAKECAVYDLLAVAKDTRTGDALQKALRAVALPEE